MSNETKPSIETIRHAFQKVHRAACGERVSYMSIPADPRRDADLIVTEAISELDALRAREATLAAEVERLRTANASLRAEIDKVYAQLEAYSEDSPADEVKHG